MHTHNVLTAIAWTRRCIMCRCSIIVTKNAEKILHVPTIIVHFFRLCKIRIVFSSCGRKSGYANGQRRKYNKNRCNDVVHLCRCFDQLLTVDDVKHSSSCSTRKIQMRTPEHERTKVLFLPYSSVLYFDFINYFGNQNQNSQYLILVHFHKAMNSN